MAQLLLGAPPPPLAHPVRFHPQRSPMLSGSLPHLARSPLQCPDHRPVGHPAQCLLPSLAHFPLWRPGHRPASCLQFFLVHRCSAQPPTYRPLRCPTHQLAQRPVERPASPPIPCPVGCLASSPVLWCRDHPRRLALWHGWPPSVPPAPPTFPLESFYSSTEICLPPLRTPARSSSLGPWRGEIPARPPGAPSDDQRHRQASLVSL